MPGEELASRGLCESGMSRFGPKRSFRASGIALGDSRERQITAKPIVQRLTVAGTFA